MERPVDVGGWDPRDMDPHYEPLDDRPSPAELAEMEADEERRRRDEEGDVPWRMR